MGMLLGHKGRIIKEVRLRCEQLLMEKLQRPVVAVISVVQRRNSIMAQNVYDNDTREAYIDHNTRRKN